MEELTILLVQPNTIWEEPERNFRNLDQLLFGKKADLVALPETFSTGFSMNSHQLGESMDGPTVKWMKAQARALSAVITGSAIISAGGKYYNRLLWVTPAGEVEHYDKRHLFALMGEDAAFAPGSVRKIFTLGAWRFCPQICYDLRFPVWSRNQDDYDVLLYLANWPSARLYAWNTLLPARAIENQCFVVATNRVGVDGNGVEFGGATVVVDPLGSPLVQLGTEQEVATITIRRADLDAVRSKFPFLRDRDHFSIN